MYEVSRFRLFLMRAMYLLIGVGLSLTTFPEMISEVGRTADSHTVVNAFLLALIILSLIGVFYPLKMLPILLFEILWKASWLLLFALPMWFQGNLDEYATSVAIACVMGVALTPIVVPWHYVTRCYFYYEKPSR